ncbi:MAG: 4-deoxy-4-formamido-L-arabinose-phosphoundecaprenol deformylase [Gammaproteobacteria bacterium]|nr:4-deoxy-4-formamido-L-arabinose-phosphoundecaprenol deformylase [Gammaproteobacteria bacterium]
MKIGLKVDVDTLKGTREGTLALAKLFERRGINASFLFSVGPDHTGRALRRLFRPGFLAKVLRTSVPSTYGWETLTYGTLQPGPHIGRKAGIVMRTVRKVGFETGLHAWDHVRWQDAVARKGEKWTRREWNRGVEAYRDVFGDAPTCCGAAGWQMNATVPMLEEQAGLQWASDTRGKAPFLPHVNGRTWQCVQLPTTLPTMDELIGRGGVTADNVGRSLVEEVDRNPLPLQVFTLHAELEGGPLLRQFEQALDGWQAAGAEFVSLGEMAAMLNRSTLAVAEIERGTVPGRAGKLAVQGPSAPSDRAALDPNHGERIA